MTVKQEIMNLLEMLPDDAAMQDIQEELDFLAAIKEGEEQADRGELVSHQQVKDEFDTWTSK